jgi:hypothetical protein
VEFEGRVQDMLDKRDKCLSPMTTVEQELLANHDIIEKAADEDSTAATTRLDDVVFRDMEFIFQVIGGEGSTSFEAVDIVSKQSIQCDPP